MYGTQEPESSEAAPPLDSLERHFLSVVHRAQEKELDTSGARRFSLDRLRDLSRSPDPPAARAAAADASDETHAREKPRSGGEEQPS